MPAQCPNLKICPSENGLFSPIILKPDLWLDGADLSTIITRDNQTSVRQWLDKSGNGRNVSQSTEASQPTLVTNSLNGLSGLDWGSSANAKGLSTSAQLVAAQVFAVAKYDGPNPFSAYASIYCGDPSFFRPIFTGSSGTNWFSNALNHLNGGAASATALPTISSPFIVRTANSNTSSATRTASYIGADSSFFVNRSWIGKIYELIIFPTILSDRDALMVEGSLAWKWGLYSFLTTSHPYRFAPPRDNRLLTRKRRSFVLLAGASGVSSPAVSPGFASRSATAYSAAIQTNVTPNFAQSTAAAFNVTIAQNIACTIASRTAEAYSVTLNQVVSPTPALRTAVAYDLSLPQTVTVGFASSAAVAYPVTINQTILATFADRTATAYAVTIPQRILPTPASREATGFAIAISQTLLPNFASRAATGFTVVISQTVLATYASRTAEGYSPTVVNVQSLFAGFAERTATAYPVDIKQTLIPNFAVRAATAYPAQIPSTVYPTFADRTATAYTVTIPQRILPTPASREATGFAIAISQTLLPNFASRAATGFTVVISQTVLATYASRTAEGYSPTVVNVQSLFAGFAERTATAYPVDIKQTLIPNFAGSVATAYPAQIPSTVYPTFADRTATGYNPSVAIVQVITVGFAGRSSTAYPTTLSQQVRPSIASRTAEGYTANVVVNQVVSPTPAVRAGAAYDVYLNQNILTSFASRSASGYNCTVAVSQYLNAGFAERTSEAYPANVFPTTYLTLLASFADRTSSAYPSVISQVNPTGAARRVPVAYPIHKLVRGTPPIPVPNVYVPEKVNLVLPKNFPLVRRAIVRRSSTKSLVLRWSILPTDYDMGDIRFVVFRSQGNSGPWTQIGVAEEGAFHWTDLDVNSPWALNSFYYILRTVSISGKGFKDSEPLYCSHDPDNIATELVRKKQVFLRTRAGVNVAFLCRKSWGAKCARCWDEVRKAPTDPDCPDCFGTGYAGGYLKPFHTLALLTPSKEIEIGGKFRDGTIYAELGPDPYVDPGDVLVDATMNLRYKITAVQQASHRGYVVSQILTLAQCDENDVVYKVNIEETLESKRGESYVVGAVSGATL